MSSEPPDCFWERGNVMELHILEGRSTEGMAQFGCIWPKGELHSRDAVKAVTKEGKRIPVQSRATAYYKDGSIKWTAHTAEAKELGECFSIEQLENQEQETAAKHTIRVTEQKNGFLVETDRISFLAEASGEKLISNYCIDGICRIKSLRSVLCLERRKEEGEALLSSVTQLTGRIQNVTAEETGPLRVVLRFEGIHQNDMEEKIPFILRLFVGAYDCRLDLQYTFEYDGCEETDLLKGIGLKAVFPADGAIYNRHLRFLGDAGSFSESTANLLTWRPRIPVKLYEKQCRGEMIVPEGEAEELVNTVIKAMPFWDTYDILQDAPTHFSIRKKQAGRGLCWIDCIHGLRARGGLAFGSEAGGAMLSMRNFWQTYPSGYTVKGLSGHEIEAVTWFYSPSAEAFDFSHYAERGYNQSYYEGYDFKGASAYGIAVTSECSIELTDEMCACEERLASFTDSVSNPAVYVGTPEYYHENRAFGCWSLPEQNTETEKWLEDQLERALDFYKQEIDQRNWYGLFNYGDFMHTYDRFRHQWRYDMGGYAWDNTELVPTLWLWLMFMRTGRTDAFELAERLSRHASEVDVYHFGPYKGMGSRHNVRHWGCPCKEARIAMAAHHRYFYYLTGDYRMEDIFDELKDNEFTFLRKDPLGEFYDKEKMVFPTHARSGPDWSSLCANWMTQWERTLDERYLKKIQTGCRDIAAAPLRLVSGPDFEFDPATAHLRYIGERATGGTHLQICMGAPSVWMEMADMTEDEEWKDMLAEYGEFYYLPKEEQLKRSKGSIGEREFSLPFMAAAMGAYGAARYGDSRLAETTWKILLHAMATNEDTQGFMICEKENAGNRQILKEIPWISTNFTAQWCLNVIMVLNLIREYLPETMEEVRKLISEEPVENWHKA